MSTFWMTFLAIAFLVVCVLLIIIVLLQKGRGGGMSGILGGGGQSAFGTRTGDVFTWVTIVLVGVFLFLAIGATKSFLGAEPEKLATPKFQPKPQPITKAKMITIIVPQKVDIFYTVDGSTPTRKSRKYEAPVRITPGTTLKARAYLSRWKDSDIQTGEYPHPSTITTTAPATTTIPASAPAGAAPN